MYCPTYVREEFKRDAAMVCFTDIPLWESAAHCARFGHCGIAFHKQALIAYGANPVFYTTKAHFERVVEISKLLDRMVDLEADREWRSEAEPYTFTEDQTLALLETLCFLQEYGYRGREDDEAINYTQREWRLAFRALPFAGEGKTQEPGMSCFYIRGSKSYPNVAFGSSDVSYLVVPREFRSEAESLAADLGCGLRIFEDEVPEVVSTLEAEP
jgi:hypothetical protein